MIWKTEHINQNTKNTHDEIQKLINNSAENTEVSASIFSLGIIGGGPKGMYALEELIDKIKKENCNTNIRVYWWNETTHFGSGPNYQTDQDDFLLINYCIGHIDAWDRRDGVVDNQLNFVQWIEQNKTIDSEVQPTDYASRALVGHYLQSTLLQIIDSKPSSIELVLIPESVEAIQLTANANFRVESVKHQVLIDNLLLATGHCYQNKSLLGCDEDLLPNQYFRSAYPITKLETIPAQSKVGIIGWGLTFIDVALALTEGRGGTFDDEGNYIASGHEPILLPFSRNQLPIMPRGPIYGQNTYILQYIDDKWLQSVQTLSKNRKIDFSKDILPILEKELKYAYYSTLLQTDDVAKVENYIHSLPEEELFSYHQLLFPSIPQASSVQEAYIHYLDNLILEAEKGELRSPLMAATAVWREASPFIAEIYKMGGFTGDSHNYLDKKLFGAYCRTSYGPPIQNMKKIQALLKAGIIKTYWIDTVELDYIGHEKHFILKHSTHQEQVDFIIDARIARPDIVANNASLYQNLYENKIIKPFDNEGYLPGTVAMNSAGKVKHPQHIPLYFYGSNTEGVFLDNDSLSRKKNNIAPFWVNEVINQYRSFTK
ncbi:FAD/NAD(P)-binding protein [Faecalibacter rhinopitheci]|uniref:FAD/NAD(P)-binding protein n=1 Tax=Faecalibacter rhinopitheci TaxID=2779678 RepID=A0A8J7K5E3_9FLAO|nr:FAD/NAD(P)-binding protein [Faecalibacter rhinopitheci]MBF0598283.1 FAD/NAD(P)-binding protein [Faecalibacter rhinopitheci]